VPACATIGGMCGRMTQQTPPSDVARIFDAEVREDAPFEPSWNVAPTDPVTVVVQRDDGRVVERQRWGLIPAWADTPSVGSRMINARAETILASPAFRVAFQRRRCIVPADGFYEWRRQDGRRLPFFLHPAGASRGAGGSGALLPMAGLWSLWKDPATGIWVTSCTVVTTTAGDDVAPLHDRMPVILPSEQWRVWLDPRRSDPAELLELLRPSPAGTLDVYPVSSRVNSVRNNGPDLVAPMEPIATLEQATLFS
jgi:putative SOS response-associated peptidase YedK